MSLWILIRSTGLSAYLLLSLSVFIGTLYSLREQIKPIIKIPDLRIIHIYLSTMALGATLLHGGMLLFHREKERLSLQEILVPFTARYDSFWMGLGTISIYFMLLLAITGFMQRKFSVATWRKIHAASYVVYVLALLHSIAVGTDTGNTWVVVFYATTGFLIAIVYLYRVLMLGRTNRTPATPPQKKLNF